MDRNKMSSSGRSQKKMSSHVGSELFALGSKGAREDTKNKIIPLKSTGSIDRKREATPVLTSASKKHKLSSSTRIPNDANSTTPHELWEQMASDCDTTDLLNVLYGIIDQEDETTLRLICGSIRQIMYSRSKIDSVLYLVLIYICKLHPDIFSNDICTSALLSTLRREVNAKNRQNTPVHILSSNIITRCYIERKQWPESFLRIYVDDAINDRFWADNELCSPFIKNVCAVFQTRAPSQNLLLSESGLFGLHSGSQQHRDVIFGPDDDSGDNTTVYSSDVEMARIREYSSYTNDICDITNRYNENENSVFKYVTDAVKEQLNKRQQQDSYTRNLLRFLCSTSGLLEVRYLCITRLELWIHNGKLVKTAQQLLSYICFNINSKYIKDHEIVAMLVKMRLKTKPLINFYMNCIKEMIILQPHILCVMLKLVVQNELSNTRNPNNMGMLATMFQTLPDQSAIYLADIYNEFLLQREDCLRTLRVFLRELMRLLRFDFKIIQFCEVFLREKPEHSKLIGQLEFKDRIFYSMVDIICLCMLLSVSPQIREATTNLRSTRDVACHPVLVEFYNQVSQIQLNAVSWMYETVPHVFKLQAIDYNQALHKILLLENPDQYSRCDQWPSEPERAVLLRMVSETPVHEETLLRIILIGITKDIPLTIPDSIDLIMLVIKRASTMRANNYPAIEANKFDIIDFLFSMAEYHHPENIKLPPDYNPPKLAIAILYWKALLIMLMISAHNPSTFGAFCWNHYPTMKMMIEMCITNQYNENIIQKEELQILTLEREQILEFESYLAAETSHAVITEENAILITQLMLMDPMGHPRKVPNLVLDQLKYLNKSLRLGHLLCRSRKPDLLLDIIQRQGTTQSMPWLSDLVQSNEGDFNHLPVQCLCEFLLFNANVIKEDNNRDAELVNFLRSLILEADSNKQTLCEVLDYIFRRLASTLKQSRLAALRGIKIIFKCSDLDENEWLLRSIPDIMYFKEVRNFIIPQLRAACQVENSPKLVMSYIQFIATHTLNDPVADMLDHVTDMAQLIVERSTMFQYIIPTPTMSSDTTGICESRFQTLKCLFVMFNNYIIKLREHHEPYEWAEYPDLLMVQFEDGIQLPLHLNIIHAFIILLTYSSNNMPESIPILDYWFPPGRNAPNAFLPNMPNEPVHFLPDWLKLRMIRSTIDTLIEAALHELLPDQIILFVQNFGTPVNSMSKLLAILDHAVIEQFELVKNAILNKAYLAHLIEIQQARGAKNGHFTVQALGLHSHSQTVPDPAKLSNQLLKRIYINEYSSVIPPNKTNEIESMIHMIFESPQINHLNYYRFRRLIHQLFGRYGKPVDNRSGFQKSIISKVVFYLHRVVEPLINTVKSVPQSYRIFSFFRALFQCNPELIENCDFKSSFVNIAKTFTSTNNFENNSLYQKSLDNVMQSNRIMQIKKSVDFVAEEPTKTENQLHQKYVQNGLLRRYLKTNTDNFKSDLCRDGILVDWLAKVDPELSILMKSTEIQYLFSKVCSDFRFYLLSIICHQSNWETLIYTLDFLLSQRADVDFDCPIVLNFIEAILNNPKFWQGDDVCISTNERTEFIIILNRSELNVFSQFIINEGECELTNIGANYDYVLCSRIKLLFRITNRKSMRNDLIQFYKYIYRSSCSHKLRQKILQQMYLMYPSIKFLTLDIDSEKNAILQNMKGCQADKTSNYLITCLANLFLKKDFEALSSVTDLLIRKLAASHPALFLRQIGVLSSLIQGRAQINLRILRDEYHFHRFIQVLRTLELLQPIVFDDAYKDDFQNALQCYFSFFKHHSNSKETLQILIKFVEILQAYIYTNISNASLFIQDFVKILIELSTKFTSLMPLHQLVQEIAILQYKPIASSEFTEDDLKHDFDLEEHVDAKIPGGTPPITDVEGTEGSSNFTNIQYDMYNKGTVSFSILNTSNKSATLPPHFMNLIKILKHSNSENAILGPLQEIECLTSKRFSLLTELFDRLLELIFSPSAQIRSNAFILLIRHLKYNPGRSDINRCTLNAYIQCLRDENSSVAATAVDNLIEMTLLLQEHATEILAVAFSLGIKSQLNTCPQIKRVLQTILLQYGY